MALQIKRPVTAFSLSPGKQKRPRVRDESHLSFLRGLSCAVCGKRPVEAAHLRTGSRRHGKRETGMQERPSDAWATPMCREHHNEQHRGDELAFWTKYGIDPFVLAMSLAQASGDEEAAELILVSARGR